MPIVKVDKKWRVILPKSIRSQLKLHSGSHLELRARRGSLVARPMPSLGKRDKKDAIIALLGKPIKMDKRKLKKIDLEKVEEEMWLP